MITSIMLNKDGKLRAIDFTLAEELVALRARVAELEQDTARYDHLKANPSLFHPALVMRGNDWKSPEEIDAAIDAAKEK